MSNELAKPELHIDRHIPVEGLLKPLNLPVHMQQFRTADIIFRKLDI